MEPVRELVGVGTGCRGPIDGARQLVRQERRLGTMPELNALPQEIIEASNAVLQADAQWTKENWTAYKASCSGCGDMIQRISLVRVFSRQHFYRLVCSDCFHGKVRITT